MHNVALIEQWSRHLPALIRKSAVPTFAPVFTLAAAPHAAPVFDYETEVAVFYRDHPAYRDKLYFLEAGAEGNRVVRAPADFASVEKKLRDNKELFNALAWAAPQGYSFALPGKEYGSIVIDRRANRVDLPRLTGSESADLENFFVFDHEVGHAICRDGLKGYDKNIKECAADSYAVIRHIQRFGLDETARIFMEMRAVELAFRRDQAAHFTSPAVEKILADAQRFDLRRLDPQQTAELANRYAISHAPHPAALEYLRRAFQPYNAKLGLVAAGDTAMLKEFAGVVLKTTSDLEFKWGGMALKALLDGKVLCNGTRIAPAGAEWDKIRKSLLRREKTGKDVFLGLEKTQPANANRRGLLPKNIV